MAQKCRFLQAERLRLFAYLDSLPVEYRKEYKNGLGNSVTVPRGQASFFKLNPRFPTPFMLNNNSLKKLKVCQDRLRINT